MTERDPIPPAIIGGRVAHKPSGRPYAYGSNPAAIRRAKREGYDGIDLDHRTNAEGHGWCFHQSHPTRRDGWVDPLGIINDSRAITSMTDEECARLRYQGQPSMSVHGAMLQCLAHGVIPCFEDKTFLGETVDYWREVKATADRIGVTVVVMSLPGFLGIPGKRKLKTANAAGLNTMWLWRRTGPNVPPFVDLVKSHNRRPIYRLTAPTVPPVPTPAPRVRRRPVRRPWRHFSRRWRRRHPSLWRRILAWRKANPRRNR